MKISKKWLEKKLISIKLIDWFGKTYKDKEVGHKKVLIELRKFPELINETVSLWKMIGRTDETFEIEFISSDCLLAFTGDLKVDGPISVSNKSLYVHGNLICNGPINIGNNLVVGGDIICKDRITVKNHIESLHGSIKATKSIVSAYGHIYAKEGDIKSDKNINADDTIKCRKLKVKGKVKADKVKEGAK